MRNGYIIHAHTCFFFLPGPGTRWFWKRLCCVLFLGGHFDARAGSNVPAFGWDAPSFGGESDEDLTKPSSGGVPGRSGSMWVDLGFFCCGSTGKS